MLHMPTGDSADSSLQSPHMGFGEFQITLNSLLYTTAYYGCDIS